VRHAKSSWKTGRADHERPLNKRGRRDAPRIAARLAELGWTPERVVSSDAERTRETWSRMADAFDPAPAVEFTRELYLAGVDAIQAAVGRLPDDVETVLVLGHNPGWEDAVTALTGEETRMTTANVALLELEGATWAEALGREGEWRQVELIRPKELDD